jgi:hypothetical protein
MMDLEFVQRLEAQCLQLARYAHQDLEKIESWSYPLLLRRYATLTRVIDAEKTTE